MAERLRRALRDNPEAAEELRGLLDEPAPLDEPVPRQPAGTTVSMNHNTINDGTYHGPVIMAHSLHDGVRTVPRQERGAK